MTDPTEHIESILAAAVELPTPESRAEYLRSVCDGDAELQRQVEELVAAYLSAGDFLEAPVSQLPPAVEHDVNKSPGTHLGRYRLLEQIGEGGFAVVFLAEQEQPVRRRVALKIIKPGMDSRQVIARFEVERQALAMMDHTGIAKIFDAGTTETGRPYFVMELVTGTPITDYCDQQRLSIDARLELFGHVCDAVQHAHQKGVIHRDLKPSNVLVATQDGKPVPKVIDFGIAKAIDNRLTDLTILTDFRQLIGTPAYMSPEQAEGSLDIDTRSDVYSLGVLLYELLSGSPPFDPQDLRAKAVAELQRIIRDVEPLTPSGRLSALDADTREMKATARNSDSLRLVQRLRGELDWIALRALEKDRERRYRSAAALGDDIKRYLTSEPVEARPVTLFYRFRKFARRNKGALTAVGFIAIALAGASILSTWQAIRASRAERQAVTDSSRAEAISRLLVQAFRSPDPHRDGRTVTIAEVLDRTVDELQGQHADDPLLRAGLLDALAETYSALGLYDKAAPLAEESLQLRQGAQGGAHPDALNSMAILAGAWSKTGQARRAVELAERELALRREVQGPRDARTVRAMLALSFFHRVADHPERAIPLAEDAVEICEMAHGSDAEATLEARHELVCARGDAMGQGLIAANASGLEELLPSAVRVYGEDDRRTIALRENVALGQYRNGKYSAARTNWQRVLQQQLKRLGAQHGDTRSTLAMLAGLCAELEEPGEALEHLSELAAIAPDHPDIVAAREEVEDRLRPAEEVAEHFIERINKSRDDWWATAPRKDVCCELADRPEAFDIVANKLPDETALWIGKGQFLIWRNRLIEATDDFAKVIHARPFGEEHVEYACLLLLRADRPAYQEFCRQTSERVGPPSAPHLAGVAARLYSLGPADCVTPDQTVEWATAAAHDRQPWQLQILGLAYLRAGRFSDAIAVYRESNPRQQGTSELGESWYGLTLAYHGLGDERAARRALGRGRIALALAQPRRPNGAVGVNAPQTWVLLNLLAREAEALLGAEK